MTGRYGEADELLTETLFRLHERAEVRVAGGPFIEACALLTSAAAFVTLNLGRGGRARLAPGRPIDMTLRDGMHPKRHLMTLDQMKSIACGPPLEWPIMTSRERSALPATSTGPM